MYDATIRVRANVGRTAMLVSFRVTTVGVFSGIGRGTVSLTVVSSLELSGAWMSLSKGILMIWAVRLRL